MAIGNCDCCDRRDVPGHVVNCPGEPFACYLCQGDEFDPYGEVEVDCVCDGEGCRECSGFGTVWVDAQPATFDDLDERAPIPSSAEIMRSFDEAIEAIKRA